MRASMLSLTLAFVGGLMFPSVVQAEHSASPCASEVTTIGAGAATLYFIDDETGTWLYQESNGHAGLQRGGAAWYELGTGGNGDFACWDLDTATGEQIRRVDFILF